ncbi:MAG: Rpn family recombination-promoting nuclease/putative transposase [Treponema sp.]|jgi:hypothetical protein|nr:Rpn family recombination-promoting nuclease/putative transposase [Treponema sp.]
MAANRQYKDSVFSLLFSNPDTIRGLYSALEGVSLPPDIPITINTLSDVIFKGQINDLSFTVDNRLIMIAEHQSTINPNAALRILMYAGRVYERIIDRYKIYRSTLITIPRPEFIVLYNGTAPYPDYTILRLSDAFAEASSLLDAGSAPCLELVVKVYNINSGHNRELLERCGALKGYSAFVEQVREHRKAIADKELAFKEAVKYCIDHNILGDFLAQHSTEVFNMLLTEWNTEEWGEVCREEGHEQGREEGQNTVLNLIRQGYTVEQIEARLADCCASHIKQ